VGGFTLDSTGGATIPIPVTAGMSGTALNFQASFRDVGASGNLGLTNALHVDFCP
jgi:hypothetical protein